jgi:CheY-like chemotaxis protein
MGIMSLRRVDGRDARVKALTQSPTRMMNDTRLSIVDEHGLCEGLRRDETTRTVQILASRRKHDLLIWNARGAAGADAVLVKPATPDAALSEVRRRPTEASR